MKMNLMNVMRFLLKLTGIALSSRQEQERGETAEPEQSKETKPTDEPRQTEMPLQTEVSRKEETKAKTSRQHNGKGNGTDNWLPADRQLTIRFNEQFLRSHYDLRYNVLKHATEFRLKGADDGWQQLTDRHLNRLVVDQLKEGGNSWGYGMKLYIDSTYTEQYNPVADYLSRCDEWDGKHDYIEEYARRLPTDYADWPRYFHRWLLALVAQALGMNSDHGNSMVPMLIGEQGTMKTTFCRNILPPELREYFMDDIKMDNAEQVERVLGRMWLVCIDEYNSKTAREQAKIKRLLTEGDLQVRRMRSDQYVKTPRLCSFIATTNDPTPLPLGDGTRRYLCISVTGQAQMDGSIPYCQMFAQAQAELLRGDIYWFTSEDEQLIQEHNKPYQQLESAAAVLTELFEPAQERKREHLWQLRAIQTELGHHLKSADTPNLHRLASTLRSLHWPQGAVNGTRGYYLKLKKQ